MITKFKLYETTTESEKNQKIRFIQSFVRFGYGEFYLLEELGIETSMEYDEDNNTEIIAVYPAHIKYRKYSGADSSEYEGDYESISDKDIDTIIYRFERELANAWYSVESFDFFEKENSEWELISFYYKNYVELLDYLGIDDVDDVSYPDTYEQYKKHQKAKEFNL